LNASKWLIYAFIICQTVNIQVSAAHKKDSDTALVNQLLDIAWQLQNTLPDSSMKLARQACSWSKAIEYSQGLSGAFMRIGSLHTLTASYDSARYYLLACYQIRQAANNMEGLSNTAISLSYLYRYMGKTDSVFFYLYECLRFNKQSGNLPDLIVTNLELGHAYVQFGNNNKALTHYLEAEKIAKQCNNKDKLIGVYSGLGNYYYNSEQYPKALTYFLRSDSILVNSDDAYSRGKTNNNIALCYEQLEEDAKALKHYHQALFYYQKLGSKADIALTHFNLSSLFINRNMPDSALSYLDRALLIAIEAGDVQRMADCYDYKAAAFVLKKDYKNAYDFTLKSTSLKDSLLNAEKISSISEMETKYKTEIKEEQIRFLNQENTRKTHERNALIFGAGILLVFSFIFIGQRNKVKKEKGKSDQLLLNILPVEVAEELKQTGESVAKQYNHVTVLFTDFVNFTGISAELSPTELVAEIHKNFTAFDAIMDTYGLEKIKTIGDAYLAVCGLPHELPDHAQRVVGAALEIAEFMKKKEGKFQIRIGINSGPVVAGIVGVKKYAYDIWGDTVNTAARMEGSGAAGKVNISSSTYDLVKNDFNCIYRGKIDAKGKGAVDMYFVENA
jgi:adenylate cyclase